MPLSKFSKLWQNQMMVTIRSTIEVTVELQTFKSSLQLCLITPITTLRATKLIRPDMAGLLLQTTMAEGHLPATITCLRLLIKAIILCLILVLETVDHPFLHMHKMDVTCLPNKDLRYRNTQLGGFLHYQLLATEPPPKST